MSSKDINRTKRDVEKEYITSNTYIMLHNNAYLTLGHRTEGILTLLMDP